MSHTEKSGFEMNPAPQKPEVAKPKCLNLDRDNAPSASGQIPEVATTQLNNSSEDLSEDKNIEKTRPAPAIEDDQDDLSWNTSRENPRNWNARKKWTMTWIVSAYGFVTPLASSMMAPGLLQTGEQYRITDATVLALTLSIFQLSFALGPLVLAPLTEIYGRKWVLHIANLFFLAFNLGCAFSPTVGSLLGFRFLSGLAGGAPIAIGGGSISDLFSERDRANALAVYTLGPLLGPVVGPIAGGFVAETIGPKYVFVIIAGLCGFVAILAIPLLRETYGPVVRVQLAKRHDPEEGRKLTIRLHPRSQDKWAYMLLNISRPITLLTRSLICFLLSFYMAFLYGVFFLMFTTFAEFFKTTYGFDAGIGLMYLGLGIGFFTSTAVTGRIGSHIYRRLSDKNGGVGTPEMRIPALIFGACIIPIGLLWYGWSAQAKLHWMMPVVGSGIFGFALMCCFLPIQLYLIDAFSFAASAFSAAGVFRYLLGFFFPLFAPQVFDKMGTGGGMTFLAGMAIVIGIPFPIFLYYRGASIRAMSKYTQ